MIPLLLIHAFPLSSWMWREEVGKLRSLARVIAPDLPGFGATPHRPGRTIKQMAQGMAGQLDREALKEPVVVAGLSMGGYVALEFVRQFPERVRGLGLFSTRAGADTPEGRQGRFKAIGEIQKSGMKPFAKAILPKLLGSTTLRSNPILVQEMTRQIESADPAGVVEALRAMADRRDSTDLLSSIACPALVVAGEEDAFIPLAEAQAMQACLPNGRLEVVRQAGHLVNLEQPAQFQGILAAFLHRLPAGCTLFFLAVSIGAAGCGGLLSPSGSSLAPEVRFVVKLRSEVAERVAKRSLEKRLPSRRLPIPELRQMSRRHRITHWRPLVPKPLEKDPAGLNRMYVLTGNPSAPATQVIRDFESLSDFVEYAGPEE